jgi:hypothetical protein
MFAGFIGIRHGLGGGNLFFTWICWDSSRFRRFSIYVRGFGQVKVDFRVYSRFSLGFVTEQVHKLFYFKINLEEIQRNPRT